MLTDLDISANALTASRPRSIRLVQPYLRPHEQVLIRTAATAIESRTRRPMMNVWVYVTIGRVLLIDTKRRGGLLESIELFNLRSIELDPHAGDILLGHEMSQTTLEIRALNIAPARFAGPLVETIEIARESYATVAKRRREQMAAEVEPPGPTTPATPSARSSPKRR